MLSVHLHQVSFHAFHGLYDEEKILGNSFTVDLTVRYRPATIPVRELDETIDYVTLYELLKQRMAVPTLLLETLATEIAHAILAKFSVAEEVNIVIFKQHPPIAQFTGQVGVEMHLTRSDY